MDASELDELLAKDGGCWDPTAARSELAALRARVEELEAVRDAAKELIDIHDDNDDDSPFPSILVHERNAVKAAIQRLNAGDAVRARRALRGET